jgi:cation transport regulator ChaC
MTMFYAAYGSNLWRDQMRQRCPEARPVRAALLPDRRLTFRLYADLERAEGETAHAALYRVTSRCIDALDRYEGVHTGAYRQEWMRLKTRDLGTIDLLLYLNDRDCRDVPPPAEYIARMKAGYRDWRLPREPLEAALRLARATAPRKRHRPLAPSWNWQTA